MIILFPDILTLPLKQLQTRNGTYPPLRLWTIIVLCVLRSSFQAAMGSRIVVPYGLVISSSETGQQ